MDRITEAIVTIITAIVGVAILSVIVSRRSNTAGVLGAAGSAFANALSAATAPVTGAATAPNVGGQGSLGLNFSGFNLTMPGMGLS